MRHQCSFYYVFLRTPRFPTFINLLGPFRLTLTQSTLYGRWRPWCGLLLSEARAEVWYMCYVYSLENGEIAVIAFSFQAPWEIPGRKPPSDWPDHGAVDFRNYGLRYRENTALVLREITCVIAGGERVRLANVVNGTKSFSTEKYGYSSSKICFVHLELYRTPLLLEQCYCTASISENNFFLGGFWEITMGCAAIL